MNAASVTSALKSIRSRRTQRKVCLHVALCRHDPLCPYARSRVALRSYALARGGGGGDTRTSGARTAMRRRRRTAPASRGSGTQLGLGYERFGPGCSGGVSRFRRVFLPGLASASNVRAISAKVVASGYPVTHPSDATPGCVPCVPGPGSRRTRQAWVRRRGRRPVRRPTAGRPGGMGYEPTRT